MPYEENIQHIIDHHLDELMDKLKSEYDEEIYGLIKTFNTTIINCYSDLADGASNYFIAAAELIDEDHDPNDGHHGEEFDEGAMDDERAAKRGR